WVGAPQQAISRLCRTAHADRSSSDARRARSPALVSQVMILAVLVVLVQGNTDSLANRVRQIADTYLTTYFERHPDEATLDGVAHTRHDRLPDNSPSALARWRQREDAWLAELEGLDPAPLAGRPEWISYGVMRDALEASIAR